MMPRLHSTLFIAVVALVLTSTKHLDAAEIENVKFHDSYKLGESRLVLQNVALMRYKVVIKAMVAALYIEEGKPTSDVLTDVSKRLEIEYFWALGAKDIAKAADELLKRNLPADKLQRLRPSIDQMNQLYQDVKPGDRYALTYVSGKGTQLTLNGKELGVVPGKEFAAAYFSIWLGSKPMDVSLRNQLLKQR